MLAVDLICNLHSIFNLQIIVLLCYRDKRGFIGAFSFWLSSTFRRALISAVVSEMINFAILHMKGRDIT